MRSKRSSWFAGRLVGRHCIASLAAIGLFCATAVTGFAQVHALTNLWSVAAGAPTHPFMDTGSLTRGLAYNPVTDHILVVSRTTAPAIHILSAATGELIGTLPFDAGLITGGTFPVNMVAVTTDGVIYVGNLTVDATGSSGPFKLYRWASETAQPELVYSGDPSNGNTVGSTPRRFGDSIALRGVGVGTQILLGSWSAVIGLLTTTDGVTFTSRAITTDAVPQDTRWGLAWGAGDTFWAKQGSASLKRFALDIPAGTAAMNLSVPLTGVSGGPMDIDLTRNLLAIIDAASHKLRLYDITNPSAPVQTDTTRDMPAANVNGNFVGAVALRNGVLYALETNNGIVGYGVHETVFPPTPGSANYWEHATVTLKIGVGTTSPRTYQWQRDEADLAGATGSSLTLSNLSPAQAGSYRVVVTSSSGSIISAPSVITVAPGNASAQASNIWSVLPNTRPYLTSGYKEYGIALNPVNGNVLVLTRLNPTNMLVVLDGQTGAEKHYVDYSGLLPLDGVFNKVDVADDGRVYLCTVATTASQFRIDGLGSDDAVPAQAGRMLFQGDPGLGVTPPDVVWGGTMAVRGAGENTQILLGSGSWDKSSKTVAILRTDASGFFYTTPITVNDAPDKFARLGVDWGPGENTFWAKSVGSLVLVEFDFATQTGFVKKIYPVTGPGSVPSAVTGIKYDPASKLLAGLLNGTEYRPVSVPIYNLGDIDAGPQWTDQELFLSYNEDIEYQGTVDFAGDRLVALGVNNGVLAFKIDPNWEPPAPSFNILTVVPTPGGVTITWEASNNASYEVRYVDALGDAWQNLGTVTATAATASYTDNSGVARRFYRIRAQ